MKTNKIFAILLGCIIALGLSSCVEKAPEYIPGEPNTASCVVTPDVTVPTNLDLNGTPIEVSFTRNNTNGAVDVPIALTDDSGIFSLQSSTLSFASGENVAKAYVLYDYDKLDPAGSYPVTVKMASEENASPYNAIGITFSCVKAWKDLGIGEFFDNLALMASDDDFGIAKCRILQSPDGSLRYRIMAPYADKAQRAAAWGDGPAQATPSDYIEFWVKDEETMQVTWNKSWLTGLWYQGVAGYDIKAYLPSALSSSMAGDDAKSCFLDEYIVQLVPYYYIDALGGGFGEYACYLSMPGGPDLYTWLTE
ncbi:MAG: hypothetical protein Q4G10_00740 [Bacteroidia bacterium]|nr:hypothetical protein [Bacteroidia bacterium]